MALTRWDPFRDVLTLQNRLNSLFQEYPRSGGENEAPLVAAGFAPPVDIYEDAQKVVLKLEIPGIRKEDLDIRVENHNLTVRGERRFESDEKEENFHRVERRYGSFYRAFSLPSSVDTAGIKAEYDAGILRLELNKREEAKPKQIQVTVGSATPAGVKAVDGAAGQKIA